MLVARLIVWLGIPAGVFALLATITILLGWSRGNDMCGTWLGPILPYCP